VEKEKLWGGNTEIEKDGFRVEKADEGDYQVFAHIIQTAWASMDQKEWFVADNADYIYQMLATGKGIGYKAVDPAADVVAGVFVAVIPGLDENNMGYDVGLPAEELSLVAHMDSVAVLPKYRGHRLQRRLMTAAEKELRERGFRYLMCTVHPDNLYSRNNVAAQGYESMMMKEKYGGYPREIFLKKLF
jgi:ribosomal protein S18 acetylase RimI-like enzyme